MAPAAAELIRRLVLRTTGVVLGADYVVEARLHALALERGVSEAELLASVVDPERTVVRRALVEAMLPYDSAFFRDHHPFETLRTEVFPRLVAARRAERRLRIWSAGCGFGQEPYSLAILLLEHFPELTGWRVEIVASDVSLAALEVATQGRYDLLEVNRGLPARLLPRWFARDDRRFRVAQSVRDLVRFEPANLIGRVPDLGLFDVILLRNVLNHLDVASKRLALTTVGGTLAADGHLVVGATEAADAIDPAWVRVNSGRAPSFVHPALAAHAG